MILMSLKAFPQTSITFGINTQFHHLKINNNQIGLRQTQQQPSLTWLIGLEQHLHKRVSLAVRLGQSSYKKTAEFSIGSTEADKVQIYNERKLNFIEIAPEYLLLNKNRHRLSIALPLCLTVTPLSTTYTSDFKSADSSTRGYSLHEGKSSVRVNVGIGLSYNYEISRHWSLQISEYNFFSNRQSPFFKETVYFNSGNNSTEKASFGLFGRQTSVRLAIAYRFGKTRKP